MSTPNLLTAAYIVKGFWSKASDIDLDPSTIGKSGELSLMQRLIGFERLDSELYATTGDEGVPFVWAYEISEPVGEWLAKYAKMHARLPDDKDAKRYLVHLMEVAQ